MARDRNRKAKHIKKSRKRTIRRSNSKTLLRVFEALNLSRRKRISSSAAAKTAGTTLPTIKRLVPDALVQDRPGGPVRVKPSDRYSEKVEILTEAGALVVTARGSRQRQLAGQHRATYMAVVERKKPASALEQFRGRKVGGHELPSDYARLVTLANAGVLGQLDRLYVSAGGGR
jgi:hypothetical protein